MSDFNENFFIFFEAPTSLLLRWVFPKNIHTEV